MKWLLSTSLLLATTIAASVYAESQHPQGESLQHGCVAQNMVPLETLLKPENESQGHHDLHVQEEEGTRHRKPHFSPPFSRGHMYTRF